jgi:hypothetical protein
VLCFSVNAEPRDLSEDRSVLFGICRILVGFYRVLLDPLVELVSGLIDSVGCALHGAAPRCRAIGDAYGSRDAVGNGQQRSGAAAVADHPINHLMFRGVLLREHENKTERHNYRLVVSAGILPKTAL